MHGRSEISLLPASLTKVFLRCSRATAISDFSSAQTTSDGALADTFNAIDATSQNQRDLHVVHMLTMDQELQNSLSVVCDSAGSNPVCTPPACDNLSSCTGEEQALRDLVNSLPVDVTESVIAGTLPPLLSSAHHTCTPLVHVHHWYMYPRARCKNRGISVHKDPRADDQARVCSPCRIVCGSGRPTQPASRPSAATRTPGTWVTRPVRRTPSMPIRRLTRASAADSSRRECGLPPCGAVLQHYKRRKRVSRGLTNDTAQRAAGKGPCRREGIDERHASTAVQYSRTAVRCAKRAADGLHSSVFDLAADSLA